MSDQFPPVPLHPEEARRQVAVFGVLGDRMTYVSTPVTGGPRWIAKVNGSGGVVSADDRRDVIDANKAAVRTVVESLRRRQRRPVINPAEFPDHLFPHWSQSDYRWMWGEVLAAYADEVVFVEGWHLSEGCGYEYYVATVNRRRCLDQRLEPLPPARGAEMLRSGVAALEEEGLATDFLRAALEGVERAAAEEAHDAG